MIPSPYKGLTHYGEEDAPFFFGREAERQVISANLMASRLTLVYGQSGVGKSSLLRAGVARHLRRLAEENVAEYETPVFVPVVFSSWRDDPLSDLREAVQNAVADVMGDRAPTVDVGESLRATFEAYAEALNATLLVILDQFEEYFLYHQGEDGDGTFAVEFPRCVNHPGLRANFLVSIREDAIAMLDRFKGRIPHLFENYLRIEHLSREAARAAIVKPIEELNRRDDADEPVTIEPDLVDAVLDQIRAGEVVLGEAGQGTIDGGAPAAPSEERIETPYLQLVMSRLWSEELGSGSRRLRLETLEKLGGAQRIIRTHLDDAMGELDAEEQDAAAAMFRHLVTPSGTKIAHTVPDLAEYAGRPPAELTPVLEELSGGDVRILRPVAPPPGQLDGSRYEIFHDVLAAAILDWRARYVEQKNRAEAERELAESREQERIARRRARIFRTVALIAIACAIVASVLGFVAWQQRTTAHSEKLAAEALAALNVNPARSVQLSADAVGVKATTDAETALRRSLSTSRAHATMFGHRDWVTSAAFSSDGRLIASASEDGTARVWDARSTRLVRTLRGHGDSVNDAAFSRDRQQVVTASDDETARVWDLVGERVRVLRGHTDAVNSAAFSPNGRYVATASEDGTVRIWEVATGKTVPGGELEAPGNDFFSDAAFDDRGERLVTVGADRTTRIWRWRPGRRPALLEPTMQQHGDWVNTASFSADGRLLVTGSDDKTAHVWDVERSECCFVLGGHTAEVTGAAFSPDGSIVATTSLDGSVRLWEWRVGKVVHDLHGHTDAVTAAEFSPDGNRLVTAGADKTVRIWNTELGTALRGHPYWVFSAAFSPDGRHAVTAAAGTSETPAAARIWDVATGGLEAELAHEDWVRDAAFSADGSLVVTGGEDNRAHVWDVESGDEIGRPLGGHEAWVLGVAVSRDGDLVATASADRTARIWNLRTRAQVHRLAGHRDWVFSAAFSPDARRLATASDDQTVRLWDVASGRQVAELTGHEGAVYSASYSPNGELLVTASSDFTVRVWDAETGEEVRTLRGHTGAVRDAAFSADGRWIASTGADKTTRVWAWPSGRVAAVLQRHADLVRSVAFSANGLILTAGDDYTAKIYTCGTCVDIDVLVDRAEQYVRRLRLED